MSTTLTSRRRARSRLLTATVSGVGVIALIAGCAHPSPAPAETDLDRFTSQKLEFGSCEGFASTGDEKKLYVAPAECARLTVPLDYDDPGGATAKIAILRIPATGQKKIGSLVVNPGGPGASGMSQVMKALAPAYLNTKLGAKFDLVGFDPRGVGASTPTIRCFTPEQRDSGDDRTVLFGTAGLWDASDTKRLADDCAKGSGGRNVLSHMGSVDAARDMDILRQALGDKQLTFAGQSYGTRLGAVYAGMFPTKVRAMVLDGVIDPRLGSAERRIIQHEGFQRSFDLFAKFCAQSADCPLGTDPTKATNQFQELTRPLIEQPAPAAKGLELNYDQAIGGVTGGLYDASTWPDLIAGIAALKNGDGSLLRAFSDLFNGRSISDRAWSNQWDANFVINCNDEQRRTPAEEAKLRKKIDTISPFMDSGQDITSQTRDGCENWPSKPSLTIPYSQKVKRLATPLIISVTGDPATPHQSGVDTAKQLGGALLTVNGEVHTVAQAGANACVSAAFIDYLVNLTTPTAGASCTL